MNLKRISDQVVDPEGRERFEVDFTSRGSERYYVHDTRMMSLADIQNIYDKFCSHTDEGYWGSNNTTLRMYIEKEDVKALSEDYPEVDINWEAVDVFDFFTVVVYHFTSDLLDLGVSDQE